MRLLVLSACILMLAGCGSAEPERWPREPLGLLEVAMACHQDPTLLGDWFPRHSLKMPMEQPAASDPVEVEGRMGPRRCEVGALARAFGEPVLSTGSAIEVYRLFWTPSFSPPVVIRVEDRPEGVVVTLKRGRSEGETLTGDVEVLQRRVGHEQLEALRAVAHSAGCWASRLERVGRPYGQARSACESGKPHSRPLQSVVAAIGAPAACLL